MVEKFVFGDKFLGTGYQNCKGETVQWNEAASGWNCSEGMELRLGTTQLRGAFKKKNVTKSGKSPKGGGGVIIKKREQLSKPQP